MIPIVTPAEMVAIDAAAPEPVEVLIQRAGVALANVATQMMGGSYGRRVVVMSGKGNNGADGRAAATYLRRRGVRVEVWDATKPPKSLPSAHLVIDAAYGTGLQRPYTPPAPPPYLKQPAKPAPILAADIASGIDGLTGEVHGSPWQATHTLTFGALKPGLLLHPGTQYCGQVTLEQLGLDTSPAKAHLLTASTAASWLPVRPLDAHKWQTACWIVAGSTEMAGAAQLATAAALRGGSGYVRLSVPGHPNPTNTAIASASTASIAHSASTNGAIEAVSYPLSASGWWEQIQHQDLSRFKAMLVGPGLGRHPTTAEAIRELVSNAPLPLVLDGDGLTALGSDVVAILNRRNAPTIGTPHDGEYRGLTGNAPDPDRFAAARQLAFISGATVLLKGPCTVVAQPDGTAIATNNGDARLATAGTGDVLAGLICGLLSAGVPPMQAAALAAWLHGQTAQALPFAPMAASNLINALPRTWQATAANHQVNQSTQHASQSTQHHTP